MKFLLLRIADDGTKTTWNLNEASDTGKVLVDIPNGTIHLNYIEAKKVEAKESKE